MEMFAIHDDPAGVNRNPIRPIRVAIQPEENAEPLHDGRFGEKSRGNVSDRGQLEEPVPFVRALFQEEDAGDV